jgi:hypothetical protein
LKEELKRAGPKKTSVSTLFVTIPYQIANKPALSVVLGQFLAALLAIRFTTFMCGVYLMEPRWQGSKFTVPLIQTFEAIIFTDATEAFGWIG